ncbi:MAG: response regulator [bacterium]
MRVAAPETLTTMKPQGTADSSTVAHVRTALVIEDDPQSAELIMVQLQAEGYQVRHAESAERALALVEEEAPSLITLDIMLPDMDGWDFLQRLHLIPAKGRIPVVIISVVADSIRGFALGAAAVLQKPLSRSDLHRSLVELGLFPMAEGRTLTVLVVDDDPKAVEIIAVRLLRMGATVIRAFGGREAISLAREQRPDLIVLDLMMPEVTGFDVVEELHHDPGTAGIPVLIVTAKRINSEDRIRLNGYVTSIMEKGLYDRDHFMAEVRRATSVRAVVA